jgi:hypothetical protein
LASNGIELQGHGDGKRGFGCFGSGVYRTGGSGPGRNNGIVADSLVLQWNTSFSSFILIGQQAPPSIGFGDKQRFCHQKNDETDAKTPCPKVARFVEVTAKTAKTPETDLAIGAAPSDCWTPPTVHYPRRCPPWSCWIKVPDLSYLERQGVPKVVQHE